MTNRASIIHCPACVVGVVVLSTTLSAASPLCPTKSEAREKYEGRIYWHSEMRCWDNRRTNSRDWPHVEEKPKKEEPKKVSVTLDRWDDPPMEETDWPDPPEKFAEPVIKGTISPLRWWNEMIEFGKARILK